ncbi:MAG: hypothetical protein KatS3mg022_0822 [Armatimonadota bacterium]|nr:MAG: hypothetical protein KatS3mg022_0822 [Armatimonadota bacterium]
MRPCNVVLLLDDDGRTVLANLAYDAWGQLMFGSNPTPYGYKAQWGYYTDAETGILLLTHRYLDPAMGRFLTRDPMGIEGGINLYAYVGNNAVVFGDPTGYDSFRRDCDKKAKELQDAIDELEHDWNKWDRNNPGHTNEIFGRCVKLLNKIEEFARQCAQECYKLTWQEVWDYFKGTCQKEARRRYKKDKRWRLLLKEVIWDPGLRDCTADLFWGCLAGRAVKIGCGIVAGAVRCLPRLVPQPPVVVPR